MGATTAVQSVSLQPLFIFLVTGAALVSATPVGSPKTITKAANAVGQDPAAPEPDNGCGFSGNQDVYGLGIRIGLYAQWLSTFLSNWLHQRKVTKMRDVNTCFQLAMLTALLAISNQDVTHAIDPYIVIIQIIGSASTITNHAAHKSQWNKTTWGGVIRFFIYFAVAGFATWFWWIGIDNMEPTPCGTKGFAFFEADLWDWFRTANKFISIVFAAIFTVLFGYTVWNFGPEFWRRTPMGRYKKLSAKVEPKSGGEQALQELTSGRMPKWTPALCAIVLIVSVLAVECVIAWNQVRDVNDILSTGQLIPLVVGVGGLIQVLYKMTDTDVRVHRPSTMAARGAQAQVQMGAVRPAR
ncbi:hypothetical protein C7212DRAFT_345521 [Tuber magnatum]|uniref:Uncharacterized protein n=1 Tax=Tuber magnatum TaxID=42249 RepID=A0A317SM88_9PEZI|nr:hypothetical protein C7212DRAFT_345521 [Tuber magnatum]